MRVHVVGHIIELAAILIIVLLLLGWQEVNNVRRSAPIEPSQTIVWSGVVRGNSVVITYEYFEPHSQICGHLGAARFWVVPYHASQWPETADILKQVKMSIPSTFAPSQQLQLNDEIVIESKLYLFFRWLSPWLPWLLRLTLALLAIHLLARAVKWIRGRFREHVGQCSNCGYDCTGMIRCPECGNQLKTR